MRRAVSNAVFEIEWLVQPEPVDSCTLRASNARARSSTTKVPDIVLHIRLIWPRWSLTNGVDEYSTTMGPLGREDVH